MRETTSSDSDDQVQVRAASHSFFFFFFSLFSLRGAYLNDGQVPVVCRNVKRVRGHDLEPLLRDELRAGVHDGAGGLNGAKLRGDEERVVTFRGPLLGALFAVGGDQRDGLAVSPSERRKVERVHLGGDKLALHVRPDRRVRAQIQQFAD
jgi:hypothetical protein